ncbi:adenosylhomocysteinase [bacterium]|nr:adenosylhomocysteinase [bacterium]
MDEWVVSGRKKLEWVRSHMPLLSQIEARWKQEKPFHNLTIAVCIHVEAKTGRLCQVLQSGGAKVLLTSCNPLSTQDDVVEALLEDGISVYAKHGCSDETYFSYIRTMLNQEPNLIIDDGGDVIQLLHDEYPTLLRSIRGASEETTTGVMRLKSRHREGKLRIPVIMVNEARMKYLFDNRYGTGQSVWTSIMHLTNLTIAGKTVVVAGYGWCGKGVTMRAKALGAEVIVTEIDPIKAIEAKMDGFRVMPMKEAVKYGDYFITVTGCNQIITTQHFEQLKEGAILSNAGHFRVEVDMEALEAYAVESRNVKPDITEFTLPSGKHIHVLADGRLVNLAAGNGHPAEIMDTSFALQGLSAEYLAHHTLSPGLYEVPHEIDQLVAWEKLKSFQTEIDVLTPDQESYLSSYE